MSVLPNARGSQPMSADRASQLLSQAVAGCGADHIHVEWGRPNEGPKRIFISREKVIEAMRDAAVFAADQVVMPGTELHARWDLLRALTQGEATKQEQLEAAVLIRAFLSRGGA